MKVKKSKKTSKSRVEKPLPTQPKKDIYIPPLTKLRPGDTVKALMMRARGWDITDISAVFGVSPDWLRNYLSKHERAILAIRTNDLKKIEDMAHNKAKEGDVQLIKYLLSKRLPERYGDKQEITVKPAPRTLEIRDHTGNQIDYIEGDVDS